MHLRSHNHIKLSKSQLTLRHPPPSTSTVTTTRQRTPPPSPTSTDTAAPPASMDTTTSLHVNEHDPGKFFYFYFYTQPAHPHLTHSQASVPNMSVCNASAHATHPHALRVHNLASKVSIFIGVSITDFSTPPSAQVLPSLSESACCHHQPSAYHHYHPSACRHYHLSTCHHHTYPCTCLTSTHMHLHAVPTQHEGAPCQRVCTYTHAHPTWMCLHAHPTQGHVVSCKQTCSHWMLVDVCAATFTWHGSVVQ